MFLSRIHIWIAGEILYASDLNTEFNNLTNNVLVAPGSPSMGDFLFFNGSIWTRFPAGESDKLLRAKGPLTNPIWDNLIQGDFAVVLHSWLLGLSADDHPQYLHLNKSSQTLLKDLALGSGVKVGGVDLQTYPPVPALSYTARVYRGTSDQIISGAGTFKIQLNAKTYDPQNCFDTTTNRYTVQLAGKYLINAALQDVSTRIMILYLYKNGSEYSRIGATSVGSAFGILDILDLTVNDYLEIWANFSAADTLKQGQNYNWLNIYRLGG